MSSGYTPTGLPFESREYKCDRHPLFEDPVGCSTCNFNIIQRRRDRERGERSRNIIDQAIQDYSIGLYAASPERSLEQDISNDRAVQAGLTLLDMRYGNRPGTERANLGEHLTGRPYELTSYDPYSTNRPNNVGYGSNNPTRSDGFRNPFANTGNTTEAGNRHPSRYGDTQGESGYENDNYGTSDSVPNQRSPPNDRNPHAMGRRNGISGPSTGASSRQAH